MPPAIAASDTTILADAADASLVGLMITPGNIVASMLLLLTVAAIVGAPVGNAVGVAVGEESDRDAG